MTWHVKKYLKNYIIDNERRIVRDAILYNKKNTDSMWIQVHPWEKIDFEYKSKDNFCQYKGKWFISQKDYQKNFPSVVGFGGLVELLIKGRLYESKFTKFLNWLFDRKLNREVSSVEIKMDKPLVSLRSLCKDDKEYKRKYFREEE